MRETRTDVVLAALQAIGLHVALVGMAFFLLRNAEHVQPSAAGAPIEASLSVSTADIARAQKLLAAMKAPDVPATPTPIEPDPVPEPAAEPLVQNEPQKMLDRPDEVTQDAIDDNATEKTEKPLPEQEAKREQGQIDLSETEREERERKARLRKQLADLQREQERAARLTRMEEERLKQVADREAQPTPGPRSSPMPAPPSSAPVGAGGDDDGLLARYQAAMQRTANSNWNRRGAPELVRCEVVFKQIPGGEVTEVRFEDCPFDAEGREFVERALMRSPMPYAGFERVFKREARLAFCHPEDACSR